MPLSDLMMQHQANAVLSQVNPAQNTWYTVLDTTLNARVYFVSVIVADTNETLAVQLTIDGQTIAPTVAATAGSNYYFSLIPTGTGAQLTTTNLMAGLYSFIEGRSVKIEVRKTTAAGTGTITSRVIYGKIT